MSVSGTPKRLAILGAVAVVLAVGVVWQVVLRGKGDGPGGPPTGEVGRLERGKNVSALSNLAGDADESQSVRAVRALGRLGPAALPAITGAMKDPRENVRAEAALAFAKAGDSEQAAPLAELVRDDPSPKVRAEAVSAMDRMIAYREIETLIAAMDDPSVSVRRRAMAAVTRIVGVNYNFQADDPPEKRKAALEKFHAEWPRWRDRVYEYWKIKHDQRQHGGP